MGYNSNKFSYNLVKLIVSIILEISILCNALKLHLAFLEQKCNLA